MSSVLLSLATDNGWAEEYYPVGFVSVTSDQAGKDRGIISTWFVISYVVTFG